MCRDHSCSSFTVKSAPTCLAPACTQASIHHTHAPDCQALCCVCITDIEKTAGSAVMKWLQKLTTPPERLTYLFDFTLTACFFAMYLIENTDIHACAHHQ